MLFFLTGKKYLKKQNKNKSNKWTPTIFYFSMNLDPHELQGDSLKILLRIKICL